MTSLDAFTPRSSFDDLQDERNGKEQAANQNQTLKFTHSPVTSYASASKYSALSSTKSPGRMESRRAGSARGVRGAELLRHCMSVIRTSKNLRCVEQSLRTIREFMVCDISHCLLLFGNGLVSDVFNRLKQHTCSSSLAEECCRFLATVFSLSEDARCLGSGKEDIEALRRIIERYFDLHSTVVEAAVLALHALCHSGNGVRKVIRESTCLEWVFVCMRHWRNVRCVQLAVLKCLTMAMEEEEETKLRIVSSGGLVELVHTMSLFPEDAYIQSQCLQFLNMLICNSGEYRRQSLIEGVLTYLMRSINDFPENASVVTNAARAIHHFCNERETRQLLAQEKTVTSLVHALGQILKKQRKDKRHPVPFSSFSEAHVLKRAVVEVTCAIQRCTKGANDNRREALRQVSITTVGEALSYYDCDQRLLTNAIAFFKQMCSEACQQLLRTGRIKKCEAMNSLEAIAVATSEVLARNFDDARITEVTCDMLLHICSAGFGDLVRNSGLNIYGIVHDVVEIHGENDTIVSYILAIIDYIK